MSFSVSLSKRSKGVFAIILAAIILVSVWLFYVYDYARPPQKPQVSRESAGKIAALCLEALNPKARDKQEQAAALPKLPDSVDTLIFLFNREYWSIARNDDPQQGLAAMLASLRHYGEQYRRRRKKPLVFNEGLLVFVGPRKAAPEGALFSFALVSGLDGVSALKSSGAKGNKKQEAAAGDAAKSWSFILPGELGARFFAGGRVFSFLPLRFGLHEQRIRASLASARSFPAGAFASTGRGRLFRYREHSPGGKKRQTRLVKLERFRSAVFYVSNDSTTSGEQTDKADTHEQDRAERGKAGPADDGEAPMIPEPESELKELFRGYPLRVPPLSRDLITKRSVLAGDWFLRHLESDGRFSYRYYPLRNRRNKRNYSYPRHAGSILILYRIYALTEEKHYLEAADRALEVLKRRLHSVADTKGTNCRYVNEGNGFGKLGTAAITVLALLERRQATGEAYNTKMLAGLLRFITWMQLAEGRFAPFYRYGKGRDRDFIAQNFSGQALWALARDVNVGSSVAAARDSGKQAREEAGEEGEEGEAGTSATDSPEKEQAIQEQRGTQTAKARERRLEQKLFSAAARKGWREQFQQGMDFQTGKAWSFPFKEYYMFPFSWEMQAILEARSFLVRDKYEAFLYECADSMLDFQYTESWPFPDYEGGFGAPEWFAPFAHAAGFQGEGLAAACGYAREAGDIKRYLRYRKALRKTAVFLLRQQLTRPATYFCPDPERALGAFRGAPTDNRQQIDYTQHVLAALLNFLEEGVIDERYKK